jgi:hypothetical protein
MTVHPVLCLGFLKIEIINVDSPSMKPEIKLGLREVILK